MNFDKVMEVQNCFLEVEKYIKVKSIEYIVIDY